MRVALISPGKGYRELFLRDGSRKHATQGDFWRKNGREERINRAMQYALQNEM
jgi:hypothetical protein